MGDRANILVKIDNRDSGVYLYSHWGGTELPVILQEALAKRWRWQDAPYLTRIIFCEMVRGEEFGETGFGISTKCCDGDDRLLEVNCQTQLVIRQTDGKSWTFEEFIKEKHIGW